MKKYLLLTAMILPVATVSVNHAAHAQKARFERTKPHVNVGTIGKSSPSVKNKSKKLKLKKKKKNTRSSAANRARGIDPGVCDNATFDFNKCLK